MDFHGNIPGGRLPPFHFSPLPPPIPDGYLPSGYLLGGGLGLGGDEMARRETAESSEEVTRRRQLEDEVRRELALERSSASRIRGIDAVPPSVGILERFEPPAPRYPSIPDAAIGQFGRKNDPRVEIPERIEPRVPRYPSIPDSGIGQFDRQNDAPMPRYPSVPDAGVGLIGRQLDGLASQYPPVIPERLDPPAPRYPSVPDTEIGMFGGRIDYGQSSEFSRGPEFGRSLLSGPGPEFGRSLELSQGGNWEAAAPERLGMIVKPQLVHPSPPRNANASSLPVVGGKGRTTTRTDNGRPITRTEIPLDSVATDWSCALCKVSTASQLELDRHLQGKEHLAVAEKANAEKAAHDDSTASPPSLKSTEAAEDDPAGQSSEVESSSDSDVEAPQKKFKSKTTAPGIVHDSDTPVPRVCTIQCFICRQVGHYRSQCPLRKARGAPRAHPGQIAGNSRKKGVQPKRSAPVPVKDGNKADPSVRQIQCFQCKQWGHFRTRCPMKKAK